MLSKSRPKSRTLPPSKPLANAWACPRRCRCEPSSSAARSPGWQSNCGLDLSNRLQHCHRQVQFDNFNGGGRSATP